MKFLAALLVVVPLTSDVGWEVLRSPGPDGGFELAEAIEPAIEVAAIWIAADGDDTGSSFVLTLERLVLEGAAVHAHR